MRTVSLIRRVIFMNPDITSSAAESTTKFFGGEPDTLSEQVDRASGFLSDAAQYFRSALPSIIVALVIAVIGVFLSRLIARTAAKAFSRSNIDGAARSFLESLIRIILYMVVLIMVLSLLKVPMSSIITLFGAAGLAVSLALQNCLSNLCGGFIILFSKPFSAGDTVELDNTVGKVQSISILYTKIVTFDNKTVFIPNGKVSDAKIINYTESPTRRIDLNFSISYDSDYAEARRLILHAIAEEKLILSTPVPVVRMSSHGESSVGIDVLVWTNNDDYNTARYDLIEAVKASFDQNGIVIPYNQYDVHIKEK